MINNPGHPLTLKTDQNIQKISVIDRKVRRLNVRMIADLVGINRETMRQTLRKNPWKNKFWMLHQDNAPTHNALLVKKFLPD